MKTRDRIVEIFPSNHAEMLQVLAWTKKLRRQVQIVEWGRVRLAFSPLTATDLRGLDDEDLKEYLRNMRAVKEHVCRRL
jgi:hypothetical protein